MRSIKSLEKGLQLLEIIGKYSEGARIKDITDALDDPISNVPLFLNSMMNVGFIMRNKDTGRYFIAPKFTEIAKKAEKNQYIQLKQAAATEMTLLRDEINENVLLAVLDGHDIHFIERLQSNRSIRIHDNPDVHYPPHVTAAGKAIIAFLDENKQNQYLAEALYHKFTDKSLVNPRMLKHDLDQVKLQGYAVNRGEFESEIMAVASPIIVSEEVLASIVVQFPTFRYEIENLTDFGARIIQSAHAIEGEIIRQRE